MPVSACASETMVFAPGCPQGAGAASSRAPYLTQRARRSPALLMRKAVTPATKSPSPTKMKIASPCACRSTTPLTAMTTPTKMAIHGVTYRKGPPFGRRRNRRGVVSSPLLLMCSILPARQCDAAQT